MRPVLALLFLPALVRGADEAEPRVRAMEEKLAAAKAWQVAFETKAAGLKESGTFKGTLTVAEGNKMHLAGAIEMGDKRVNWKAVSDGESTREEGLDRGTRATSKKLTDNLRGCLTHGGYVMGIYLSSSDGDGRETWPAFKASDFRSEKGETLGKRRAHVISCKLTPADGVKEKATSFSEKLWLDTETGLPLKRVFTGTLDGRTITFTETYESFALDPKIDATLFELPK